MRVERFESRIDVQARLNHIKQYLHYVRLRWDYTHTDDDAEKKELALAILTHCYRTRYSYMNHWAAMHYSWSRTVAEDFDEPDWAWNGPSTYRPWGVEWGMKRRHRV